jgi:endonuclease I
LKKIIGLFALILAPFALTSLFAQNYYTPALGQNGSALKTSLHNIIKNHLAQPWPLWNSFQATDSKPNTQVWDIYSDIPGGTPPYTFNFVSSQCGTYSSEGDCFNHEHTWPSTFFNDGSPMRTDLHHVLPTDGYVNNKRSNWPYGQVTSASWNGQNGSKLGNTNSYSGYSDKAFEPIDSFKGDIARIYFYMTTRYEGEDAGWSNWTMANGANLTQDAINMLMQWHHKDPVSQKELNRNEAIYAIQGNRNPFIDYPIFADCIWGTTDCTPLNLSYANPTSQITVYPNPSSDFIYVSTPNEAQSIRTIVYSLHGQRMLNGETNQIDLSSLPHGLYMLEIQIDGIITRKLISKD